jgi:hypothetical protein
VVLGCPTPLAYLWDEVVANLRKKVAHFDLSYFYDTAVADPQDRKRYKTEEQLGDLADWVLIKGCYDCGIITNIGYKHLDYIRDMRNWASAAHPNQYTLTGLQLATWLETCIKEVIAVAPGGLVVEVKRLLANLRTQTLSAADVAAVEQSVAKLPDDLMSALLRSAFGLYCDPAQDARVRQNVQFVAKSLWKHAPEDAKFDVGIKHSNYSANADVQRKTFAHDFLEIVDGLAYLPESELALELSTKVKALYNAHYGWSNFHTEPPIARDLQKLVPNTGVVPTAVLDDYVKTLVLAKLGRTSGVAINGEPIYDELISRFADPQIRTFLKKVVVSTDVENKANTSMLAARLRAIAATLIPRAVHAPQKAALAYIFGLADPQVPKLAMDSKYKALLARL